MRKLSLFLIFFFIFHLLNAQQNIIVHYKKQMDIVALKHEKPEILAIIKKEQARMENNLEKIKYELKIYNNNSEFSHLPVMEIDQIQSKNMLELAISAADGAGNIYLESNGECLRELEAYGRRFLITSDISELDWKITRESKTIMGYKCYKAETSVELHNSHGVKDIPVTAYFAPDLTFPFGPAGYGKLPGLILELRKGKFVYYAMEIKLNASIECLETPSRGKLITQEQFNQIGKQMWGNRAK